MEYRLTVRHSGADTQKNVRKNKAQTHTVRFVTLRLSIQRRSKNKVLHNVIGVAETSRPELVLFLVFRTSAGTSDVLGYCDCRHVCDVEESHHEHHDESDHVRETRDDHRSASGSEDSLDKFSNFPLYILCLQGVLRSLLSRCLLLGRVVRPFFGLCSWSVLEKERRKSTLLLPLFQILPFEDCVYTCSCMRIWCCSSSK